MSRTSGLRRLVVLSLSVLALGLIALSVVGSYVFYALVSAYSPASISDTWLPSSIEVAWIAGTALIALSIAGTVAFKLSRRILAPLNAVAHSLRELAQGNLQARARMDVQALGETAQLVRDFNAMAERLQSMTREQQFWNAAVAHELRTPVTILRGRLQGLAEGVFPPNAEVFNGLLRQVEGLSRLIEDLRTISLQDSGHLKLDLKPTDLPQEIAIVVQTFTAPLQARGFSIHTTVDVPIQVVCDAIRIRQALMALLENALKYATPGELQVRASISKDVCILSVEDDGPGIASDIAPHVFEAFRRAPPPRSQHSGGSGLGLAVVKTIAEAHGGHVTCAPSTRGGTIFSLRWPTSVDAESEG